MRLGIPSFALEELLWLMIVLSSYKNLRSCRNEVWKDFWFIIGFCSKPNVRPFMAEHRGSPRFCILNFSLRIPWSKSSWEWDWVVRFCPFRGCITTLSSHSWSMISGLPVRGCSFIWSRRVLVYQLWHLPKNLFFVFLLCNPPWFSELYKGSSGIFFRMAKS